MAGAPVAALLTDFGLSDNYVALLKATLLKQKPDVQFIDITHAIPPQNIRLAAFQLLTCYATFPAGTFFVAVVDPGVGSDRPVLYAEADGWKFVAPDNGLLSWTFNEIKPERVFQLSGSVEDVAAELLAGVAAETLGRATDMWEHIPFPAVKKAGSQWRGEILAMDGFGNLVTNVKASELEALATHSKMWIRLGEDTPQAPTIRGLSKSYTDGEPGKLMAVHGSTGYVEISVPGGSAVRVSRCAAGAPVLIEFHS